MTDETYATYADEIRLVARHEATRTHPRDPADPNTRILLRRLAILAEVEALLRQAHAAGRVPKQQTTGQ